MKSIYNVLSGMYTKLNNENYAAYEIRLWYDRSSSTYYMSWENYAYGHSATTRAIDPNELPNWVIRLAHKHDCLWASECEQGGGFTTEAGTIDNGIRVMLEE